VIAKRYGTVVIEDLNVRGMVRDGSLAKGITDQGWYQFREVLEYKSEWRGGELIEIGRFDPSSKMCSNCGSVKHGFKLSERAYHCGVCGLAIDRDLNAAINVLRMGFLKVGVGIPEFTPVEMPLAGYLIREGISHFVEAGTSNPSRMRGCQRNG